ncbi:chitotriosidase-1 [Procambarus clarkii]|uniref:chitotriosidase-1 n=1 Tax=Procambarus clarkii TaxID=6728 RepID=UPI003743A77D
MVVLGCVVVVIVTVVLGSASGVQAGKTDPRVLLCYYASWAHYRQDVAKYTVGNIPVELCTHLVYAFAILDPKTFLAKQHDPWLDNDLHNYRKFVQLKRENPNLKVLLGLGGWNDSRSSKYSKLVVDAGRRRRFVEEVVKLLLQHGFDGLDLDWEYPGYDGDRSDKAGFTAWLVDLKSALRPHGLLLTSAVSAGRSTIDTGYDVPKVAQLLDLINLMTYDFHGSWEDRVGHHAPLYAEPGHNPELCVDFAVNYWIQKGAPAYKLVLGVPLYGRSWTLAGPETSIGAPATGPGQAGRYTKEPGNMAFFECCLAHRKGDWRKVKGVGGPYLTKGDQWVGYDDADAVKRKAEYAVSKGLAGVLVWDVTTDDFGNFCGDGKNPLLTALATTLSGRKSNTASISLRTGPPATDPFTRAAQGPPSRDNTALVEGTPAERRDSISVSRADNYNTNNIFTLDTPRKNSFITEVNNSVNNVNTITEPPAYPWLLRPFFRKWSEVKPVSPGHSLRPRLPSTTSSPFARVPSRSSVQSFHSGFVAPSQSGFVAPSQSGFVAPSQSGFVAPSQSGFVAPSQSGFVAPSQSGFVAPSQSGFVAPSQSGFVAPSQSGFVAPSQSGFVAPSQSGFVAPSLSGFVAPSQSGFVAPSQSGFVAPSQSGFVAPSQSGFVAPSQSGFVAPSQSGFVAPSQSGFVAPSQSGFVAPSQSGFNPLSSSSGFNVTLTSWRPTTPSVSATLSLTLQAGDCVVRRVQSSQLLS